MKRRYLLLAVSLFTNNFLFIGDLLEDLLKKRLTATARLKDTLKPAKKNVCVNAQGRTWGA